MKCSLKNLFCALPKRRLDLPDPVVGEARSSYFRPHHRLECKLEEVQGREALGVCEKRTDKVSFVTDPILQNESDSGLNVDLPLSLRDSSARCYNYT